MFSLRRQQLEGMLTELKELPARLRMYESFEYVRKLLHCYTKVSLVLIVIFLNRNYMKSTQETLRKKGSRVQRVQE